VNIVAARKNAVARGRLVSHLQSLSTSSGSANEKFADQMKAMRWQMKIQNIIRTSTIAVGIAAAALFLASSVRAQEIVNTEFSDGPYVATFSQPATTTAAAPAPVSAEATTTTADANTAISPTVMASTPFVTEQAMVSFEKSAERWLIVSLMFGGAMLVIYAIAEVRRANRETYLRARTPLTRGAALY
jgi:hypothetical protein